MNPPKLPPGLNSPAYRRVTAALGLLFVGLAVAILPTNDGGIGSYGAALGVGGLGIDALVSAARQRRSLLSRLGPLP
jgi:hypothetical protein